MFETQILDSFHMPVLTGSQNSYSCGNNFRGIWFVWHYSQIPSRLWLKHTGKAGVWTLKNLHISYVPKTLQGQDGTGRITRITKGHTSWVLCWNTHKHTLALQSCISEYLNRLVYRALAERHYIYSWSSEHPLAKTSSHPNQLEDGTPHLFTIALYLYFTVTDDIISCNLSLGHSNKMYSKWPLQSPYIFFFWMYRYFSFGVISYLDVIQTLSKYRLSYSVNCNEYKYIVHIHNTIIIWSTFKCLLWCTKRCFYSIYKSFILVSILWLLSNTHAIFSKVQDALPKKKLYECSTHWRSIIDAIQFFSSQRIYFT